MGVVKDQRRMGGEGKTTALVFWLRAAAGALLRAAAGALRAAAGARVYNSLLVLPLVLSAAVAAPAVPPVENPDHWYQVDVIVFKPEVPHMDEEGRGEVQATYPHNLIALARKNPRPLRLSQLEQMRWDAAVLAAPVTETPPQPLEIHSPETTLADILNAPDGADGDDSDDGLGGDGLGSDGLDGEAIDTAPPPTLDEILASAAAQSLGSIAFEPGVTNSSLAGIARSLNRSPGFEVLWHQSWVQPITRQVRPVMLQAGQRYDDAYELEGSLSFHRERYIHLRPQLRYTLYQSRNPSEPEPDTLSDPFEQALRKVETNRGHQTPTHTWQMTQTRRLPTGEVHYLDHPLFGVIVRVRKYEWE